MFERRTEKLLSPRRFYQRMAKCLLCALLVVAVSLVLGMAGYHGFENLPWLDALLNASMILSGMGPVDPVKSAPGKWFASFYALYSGLVLIALMGLVLAPVFHRILHAFHQDSK